MWQVDATSCTEAMLEPVVAVLAAGGIVAFPTDTLYGLAVDPCSIEAVAALFAVKGRDATAALPLIASSRAQVEAWCGLSSQSARLADAFWPGPLSLVCDAPASVVASVHAGLGTVAIRVPAHPVARALAAAWGRPLTATSANRSGEAPASTAGDVRAAFGEAVAILDAGPTPGGAPSTIVDARAGAPTLVREGAIVWSRVLHSLQR